jgi:hypothetical protein
MIPKVIHYCWLSDDPYPESILMCINSWKKHLPEYELYLWDLSNAPKVPWVIEAYEQKKYAFAADYIRFYALYNYGGIYLDSDVEILKSFNDILDNKSFIGYEIGGDFEAAVIGAEKECEWVKKCLEAFDEKHFVSSNGRLNMTPVPLLINTILNSNYDLSKSNIDVYYENSELAIFPYYIFSPKNIFTKKIDIKKETICIHHFEGKWVKKTFFSEVVLIVHRLIIVLFGQKRHNAIVRILRF